MKIDFRPVGYVIEYPLVLNNCMARFIDDFNDDFAYDSDLNGWILAKNFSEYRLEKIFREYLALELQRIILMVERKHQKETNKYFFLCEDGQNRVDDYVLMEGDILLNMKTFTKVWEKIFNAWFKKGHDHNIIFCKHKDLLALEWPMILFKKVLGSSKTNVLGNEVTSGMKLCLTRSYTSVETRFKNLDKLMVEECAQYVFSQMERN